MGIAQPLKANVESNPHSGATTTKAELKMDENGWEIELYLLRLCVRLVKVVENLVLVENSKLLNGGEKNFHD